MMEKAQGLVEKKNFIPDKGFTVDGYEKFNDEDCDDAAILEHPLSRKQEAKLYEESEQDQEYCIKTTPNYMGSKSMNQWDRFMFEHAYDDDVSTLPEEVLRKLSSNYNQEAEGLGMKWFDMSNQYLV